MAPIHDAARAGDVEALRRELERGVSPDTDEYGMTPLFTAAHRNNANCIPLLLRAGADPNASMNGISALIMAASYGSRDAVCMLLEAGALVDVKTEWGWTAMDYAYTSRTFAAICPLLLRAGSELPRAGGSIRNDPYLSRIMDAGGFKAYESAHLAAVTPHCPYFEYLPAELTDSKLRQELVQDDLQLIDGKLAIPKKPGLGIEVNMDALKRFSQD